MLKEVKFNNNQNMKSNISEILSKKRFTYFPFLLQYLVGEEKTFLTDFVRVE